MRRKPIVVALVIVLVTGWLVFARACRDGREPHGSQHASRGSRTATHPAQPVRPETGGVRRPAADVDPRDSLRLEGQVLGPDGEGVAGAEVWLDLSPPRRTETDGEGAFVFEGMVSRTYTILATSGERSAGPLRYTLIVGSEPAVLRLAEAATVIVTVVNEAGAPVPGAEVHIRVGAPAGRTRTTDEAGTAWLTPISPGLAAAEVRATGYAPAVGSVAVGSPGAVGAITVVLRRGYAAIGRVVDDAGAPVADVRITTTDPAGTRLDAAAAKTDARGAFTIPALASGSYALRAVDDEHAPSQVMVRISGHPVEDVSIVMTAGGVVFGTVFDAARIPVPFASVHLMDGDQSRDAVADGQGAFKVTGLPRRALRASAESALAVSKIVDVDLAAQASVGLWLVLDTAGQISGTVVDPAGALQPGLQVTAWPAADRERPPGRPVLSTPRFATSDGAGRFVVYGLSEGAYQLSASRRAGMTGFGEQRPHSTPARTGDRDVRIVVAADGALTGKVTLAGSSAAPKLVTVTISSRIPTPAHDDGVFHLSELAPGTYNVMFQSPDFADLIKREIEIKPGMTTDLGTITAVRGRVLAGKVVDAAGVPVPGAQVKVGLMRSPARGGDPAAAFAALQAIRSGVADPAGGFVIPGLPPIRLDVMASHPERGTSGAIAVPGDPRMKDDPAPVTLVLAAPDARPRQ